jgi:uncharacterized OB-fold protein
MVGPVIDPMARPVPVADETSAPFWEAAARGELVLARCSACSTVAHPPAPVCPACGSTDPAFTFAPAATTGVVRSWTVLRQPFLPGFADDLPIVLVDVAIDGTPHVNGSDVRLIGRLLDGVDAPLALGAAVTVDFERLGDGIAVPAFRLAAP